jgi:hypothetical protein
MENVMKKWKRYLNEQGGSEQYQLFSDMDGVLVNFEGGVLEYMNEKMREIAENQEEYKALKGSGSSDYKLYKAARKAAEELGGWDVEINKWHIARSDQEGSLGRNKKIREFMYRLVENNVDLWANLGWEKGGKRFWNYIKDIPGLEILSAPMAEGSKVGKRIWVERELGLPVSKVNLSDSKQPYGEWNGKQGLLIDDRDKYVNEFRAGGGIAIKHDPNNVDNTIRQLQKYGF